MGRKDPAGNGSDKMDGRHLIALENALEYRTPRIGRLASFSFLSLPFGRAIFRGEVA